ncbi:hypothetical protein V1512DRAFT_249832 [Lipomyces arxii]|uniref:uncharacterized protein n=1 Tax=Lipomyces arxii TaxID=56418 RepID=UPI0034CFA12A
MSNNSNVLRQPARTGTPAVRPATVPFTGSRSTQIKTEFGSIRAQSSTPSPGESSPSGSAGAKCKYTDYRLRPYSADERTGKRFHVMKFSSKQTVDPTVFQQPVTMQRKDPRSLRYDQVQEEGKDGDSIKTEGGDKMQDVKPDNGLIDMAAVAPDPEAMIAPDGNGRRNRKNMFQKKTRQVFTGHEEERQLRYEEHFPWIVEDFDGKNTWVGNYEAAQSECYVLFVFDEDGFKMVPAEKWYKFTQRKQYKTLSLEEAEAAMAKNSRPPRWFMKHLQPDVEDDADVPVPKKRLRTTDRTERGVRKREDDADADELDFDEEFADDEEAPIMEGPEEENREVEQRMKRQMRVKSEELGDDDTILDEDRKIGKTGRELQRSLKSLENNAIYDSDDEEEEDPFNLNMLRSSFQPKPEPTENE